MMAEVYPTVTPLSLDEAAEILCDVYKERFGSYPPRKLASVLLAIIAVENAGGKSIIQHNWGNLVAFNWRGDFWQGRDRPFRAYASHERGASGFLALIFKRYPGIVRGAIAGNVPATARAIVEEGYCPAPECSVSVYEKALRSWIEKTRRAVARCPAPADPIGAAAFGGSLALALLMFLGTLRLV